MARSTGSFSMAGLTLAEVVVLAVRRRVELLLLPGHRSGGRHVRRGHRHRRQQRHEQQRRPMIRGEAARRVAWRGSVVVTRSPSRGARCGARPRDRATSLAQAERSSRAVGFVEAGEGGLCRPAHRARSPGPTRSTSRAAGRRGGPPRARTGSAVRLTRTGRPLTSACSCISDRRLGHPAVGGQLGQRAGDLGEGRAGRRRPGTRSTPARRARLLHAGCPRERPLIIGAASRSHQGAPSPPKAGTSVTPSLPGVRRPLEDGRRRRRRAGRRAR